MTKMHGVLITGTHLILGFRSLSPSWSAKAAKTMIYWDRGWELKVLQLFVIFYTFQHVETCTQYNTLVCRRMFYNKSNLEL
jgi:hypothetical protein